jgi:hypothetical protein
VKAPPPPPPQAESRAAAPPAVASSYRQPPATPASPPNVAQKSTPAVSNRMLYWIFGASALLFALSILILVYLYVKGKI